MCGLSKFHPATSEYFKRLIGEFCQHLVNLFELEEIGDRDKVCCIKTLTMLLLSSEGQLESNLNSFFVFLFNSLKANSQNFTITDALFQSFNSIASYACLGSIFAAHVFPHIVAALKLEYSPESFAGNSCICDIVHSSLTLSAGQLTLQQVNEVYNLVFRLLEFDDDHFVNGIIKITSICIKLYGQCFKITKCYDGSLSSAVMLLIAKKYFASRLDDGCSFCELLKLCFSTIPNFQKMPDLFKLMFFACSALQDASLKPPFVLCCLSSIFVFFNEDPSHTIRFFSHLKGFNTPLAFNYIFQVWFNIHIKNTFPNEFFYRFSTFTITRLYTFCIEQGNDFLHRMVVHVVYAQHPEAIRVSLCNATAVMLLCSYSDFSQSSIRKLDTPPKLNPNYWIDFVEKLEYVELMKVIRDIFSVFTPPLISQIKNMVDDELREHLDILLTK